MKSIRIFLVIICALWSVMAYPVETRSGNVGGKLPLYAPERSSDDSKPDFHSVEWNLHYVFSGSKDCVTIIAPYRNPCTVVLMSKGKVRIRCIYHYYDKNNPLRGKTNQTEYYDITINAPNEGGSGGDDPGTGGGGGSGDNDEVGYFYDTTEEGHKMLFYRNKHYQGWYFATVVCDSYDNPCVSSSIAGKVTIPNTAQGIPVRTIGNFAFNNMPNITEIVIPSSVEYIDVTVTYDCPQLKTITCLAETPPRWWLSKGAFFDNIREMTLYVPSKSAKEKYAADDNWKGFKEIRVIGETNPKLTLSASPSGGSVDAGTKVYLTASADGSTVSGANIYYTTNGTTPSESSNKYTSSGITINEACTLKAIVYKDGYETSDVGSWSYTITAKPKLTLSASPSGGNVNANTKVYLTAKANGSTVSDADIYYTTNGTTPSKSSNKYTPFGIAINLTRTLKAIAYKDGYETSDVGSWSYTIATVEPTAISVSPSSQTIKVGGTFTASYSLTPSNAVTTVTWSSDNSSIASVSNTGIVTGVKAGTTYIRATTLSGKSDYCKVTVEQSEVVPTSISVSPSSKTIKVGGTFTVSYSLTPSNASTTVTWSSDNSSIASVSSTGKVTGVKAGSTYINAKTANGKTAYCKVTVEQESVKVTNITLNEKSLLMPINSTKQLTATIYPSNAPNKSLTWSSSNTNVAIVSSNGSVTAKNVGFAYITCKANDGSGVSAQCTIYVNNGEIDGIQWEWDRDDDSRWSASGEVEKGERIRLVAGDVEAVYIPNCTYYYTLDGSTPTRNSTHYTDNDDTTFPITINNTCTLKAFATAEGYKDSKVETWNFTVKGSDNSGIAINATNFPDGNFRNYLLEQDYGKDGKLTEEEIKNVKFLDIKNKEISSLKGIEYFTALTTLYCYNNQLTALDVSKNTTLAWLDCACNQLTILDVSRNTALTHLSCSNNQLTALDVSGCTQLDWLGCGSNQLTALDVSKNTALTMMYCYMNKIKGASMDNLINSLPTQKKGYLYVYYQSTNEGNVCTKEQVKAAKGKGWKVYYFDYDNRYGHMEWLEYEGSDDTSSNIDGIRTEAGKDAPVYNLRGERLKAPQKGVNIIGGRKVVVR